MRGPPGPPGPPWPPGPNWPGPQLPVKAGAFTVNTLVLPALLQEDHWEQIDDDSELYDETAVGVAEHDEARQLETDAAWVAPQ